MGITKDKILINDSDGWVQVLDVAGFVVVQDDYDFQFAYSPTAPLNSFVGNANKARVIDNNSTSILWIKTNEYRLTVIPNEE